MPRSTVVRHEAAVGGFVVLSSALLMGGLAIKGTRVGFGAREAVFKADAGHDLKKGAPVKVRGIEVGEVSRVELQKDNSVEIGVKIFPDYRDNIRSDAIATIIEPPLFGASSVELTPGKGDELVNGTELKR
jgi:phospholipid/cholesterol/gamma-HCH transport system substrate-binding protein